MAARTATNVKRSTRGSDPMPGQLDPMLAVPAHDLPADAKQWGFEYKWDGVRVLCYWDGIRLRLESRNRMDVSGTYPEIAGLSGDLGRHTAVLDGEIIAVGREGRPDFGLLQRRMGLRRSIALRQAEVPVTFMLFDLLYLDGRLLLDRSYRERRRRLEGLGLSGAAWKTPPSNVGEGEAMLRVARERGLEGVMAKRLASPYQPGRRSSDWLKLKIAQGQEFVVGGWVPLKGDVRRGVGALLLGYYEAASADAGRRLIYAGKVGTGFKDEDRTALRQKLRRLGRSTPPFAPATDLPEAFFVRPVLVVDIEYRGWTQVGRLRQPSFKGLRMDKDPVEVIKEAPA